VYIGDANVTVLPGRYTYELSYTTTRQLGYFADHDELYWNVTGNGWSFPIDFASAFVRLPAGVPSNAVTLEAYTGPEGSKGAQYTADSTSEGYSFATTAPLAAGEGLTIVVSFPKGHVAQPSKLENTAYFLRDNLGALLGSLLTLGLLVFYIRMWQKRGRDPKKGTVVAQYESPEQLTPAAIRYITRMSMDTTALTAAVLDLAVHGFVRITEEGKKYTITKDTRATAAPTEQQSAVLSELFTDGDAYEVSNKNYKRLREASKALEKLLSVQYQKTYFVTNGWVIGVGVLWSFIAVICAAALGNQIALVVIVPALLIINIVFGFLMPRRTPEGRRVQDEIEGFKLFLSVTEKDRLNFHNPPGQTPELFEKMLPFALALGVEQKWAEQFTSVFRALSEQGNGSYVPAWYVGTHFNALSVGSFASDLGDDFASAISTASSPPGSSSGSGGGGFSGGGGGGGGGGGW
jgi:uncharacterized membrane protein